jgi:hypothetical protein
MPVLSACRFSVLALLSGLVFAGPPDPANPSSCDAMALQHATTLTFHQKTCFYGARVFSSSAVYRAAFFSGIAQWRNSAHERDRDMVTYGHLFSTRLAQNLAKNTGEYLVGSLNREDPRSHRSGERGFWRRTRYALLNTVMTQTDDGHRRPAFSHMAGALSSGFLGEACYPSWHGDGIAGSFRRSGLAYGGYFGRALFNEFRPELRTAAFRILRKR